MKFRLTGRHAQDVTGGRMLAPGDEVEFTKQEQEDPHNRRLIEEGVLLEVPAPKKKSASKSTKEEDEG